MLRALSFGEILWDIIEETPYLGGAPFNLAAHLSKMGVSSSMVSAVGNDDLGKLAIQAAEDIGLDTTYITVSPQHPTGTVEVFLDSQGHPDYTINQGVAWDVLTLADNLEKELISSKWDVLCFGTLAQRSDSNRSLLLDVLSNAAASHVFYDVNLRQDFYTRGWIADSLSRSTIVKLNDEEVVLIAKMLFGLAEVSQEAFAERLADEYALDTVLITRGAGGSLVLNDGVVSYADCKDVEVVDTVGAGDSFSAGFLFAYLSGNDAEVSAGFAADLADYVVSNRGAIPQYSEDIRNKITLLGGN